MYLGFVSCVLIVENLFVAKNIYFLFFDWLLYKK